MEWMYPCTRRGQRRTPPLQAAGYRPHHPLKRAPGPCQGDDQSMTHEWAQDDWQPGSSGRPTCKWKMTEEIWRKMQDAWGSWWPGSEFLKGWQSAVSVTVWRKKDDRRCLRILTARLWVFKRAVCSCGVVGCGEFSSDVVSSLKFTVIICHCFSVIYGGHFTVAWAGLSCLHFPFHCRSRIHHSLTVSQSISQMMSLMSQSIH